MRRNPWKWTFNQDDAKSNYGVPVDENYSPSKMFPFSSVRNHQSKTDMLPGYGHSLALPGEPAALGLPPLGSEKSARSHNFRSKPSRASDEVAVSHVTAGPGPECNPHSDTLLGIFFSTFPESFCFLKLIFFLKKSNKPVLSHLGVFVPTKVWNFFLIFRQQL